MILPCYVISLNNNLGPQGDALKNSGLDPLLFNGINAKNDEHLDYLDTVSTSCKNICPKSVMGIGLSHIHVTKKIYDSGVEMALILEDDAFPIVDNLNEQIIKTLSEVPDDWEIIRLHCDTHCVDGSNKIGDNSSNAAYIINRKGRLLVNVF